MANGADCTTLSIERIRAKIQIGSYYYVTTGLDDNAAGDIISFTINKSRGQPISTMNCQLAVWIDNDNALESFETVEDNMGERVVVMAGALEADAVDSFTNLPTLFTGYITSVRENPHWSDARKYILDVTAEDVFARMKYMGKFSRRFKYADDAFATINGGVRRQGGNMTRLQRVPPGRKGIDFVESGNDASMDRTPLVKTPDYKPKTPEGVSRIKGSPYETGSDSSSTYRMSPSNVAAGPGSVLSVKVSEQSSDGTYSNVDLESKSRTANCIFNCNGQGLRTGDDPNLPVKYELTDSETATFTVKAVHAHTTIMYIDPQTGGTAVLNIEGIPPHDHRDMDRGGPAVAVYDTFGV